MEVLARLGIDWHLLLTQVVNFGLLFAGLTYFLYKPILRVLDKRKKTIAESLANAGEIEKKLTATQNDYDQIIREAHEKAELIKSDAKKDAERIRSDLIKKAEEEATDLVQNARKNLESERNSLYADIKQKVCDLSRVVVVKVLGKEMTAQIREKSIENAMENIKIS